MVKRAKHILFLLIATLCAMLTGCEVIGQDEQLIVLDTLQSDGLSAAFTRHHLLIEYTGVNCVNCPRAAETAHELENIYPNLIIVAMHPASNPFTKAAAKYDYTCPEADVYYQFMGGQPTTPFPTGNLNFTASNGNYLTDHATWATSLRAVQEDTALVRISLSTAWQEQQLHVSYALTLLSETERSVDALLWIIENDIVGAQNMPDGSLNMEYTHQHMLRTSLNGDWGDNISLPPMESSLHEGTYPFSDKWVRENCRLILVVLDHNTRQLLNAQSVELSND